jgi:carboxypeptidase D
VLFSGAEDLISNHIGTEELINNMEWNGGKGFEMSPGTWAPRRDWLFEGGPAGFWKEARNLTYVLFYNSSHMVPFDFARRTRDMLDRFMKVDIASIRGVPADSRIDGKKGPGIAVGGHPNCTVAVEAELAKLEQAKWRAYYKSGKIVLVIVAIAATSWGYYVWRERRQHTRYKGFSGGDWYSVGNASDDEGD